MKSSNASFTVYRGSKSLGGALLKQLLLPSIVFQFLASGGRPTDMYHL